MQSLSIPTGVHNPNGHTAAEVLAALQGHSGARRWSFRYDLLSATNALIQPLTCVLACSITQNWLAEIKRTARLTIQDTGEINFLEDRIQPWTRLHIPPYGDDDWVEWPQGVFLLSSPTRGDDEASVVTRSVEAYDQLLVYADDLVATRYAIDPVVAFEDFEDTTYAVTPGGTWARATDQALGGTYSLKSAVITHSQSSSATMTVPTGATQMSVWYKVSSESESDTFDILVGGVSQDINAAGEVDWTQVTVDVTAGATVTFRYTKDSSISTGSDCAWIDNVEFRKAVKYTDVVSTLLGSVTKNVTASTSTIPTVLEWEPGTSKLKIINELLGAINYESLSFDELGTAIARPYETPAVRAEEYVYAADSQSVILPGVEQTLDLFNVANSWTIAVTEPDRDVITATYTNNDPSSPTSTVSRQRTITDFRTEQSAADQAALDAKVERLAFEASQVYEKIEMRTGLMPIHSGNDVIRLRYPNLAIDAKYVEHEWSTDLKPGAQMRHRIRRVVTV